MSEQTPNTILVGNFGADGFFFFHPFENIDSFYSESEVNSLKNLGYTIRMY